MRTKLSALVIFFLWVAPVSQILSVGEVFAQYVDTGWVRRYNGTGDYGDVPYTIAVNVNMTAAELSKSSIPHNIQVVLSKKNQQPQITCPDSMVVHDGHFSSGNFTVNGSPGDSIVRIQAWVTPGGTGIADLNVIGGIGSTPTTGHVEFNAICGYPGIYKIWVKAIDRDGLEDSCNFQVRIYNFGPFLICPNNGDIHAGQTFTSSNFIVTDPEVDPTTVIFLSIYPWATNTPTIVNSHVEWVTTCSEMGVYFIQLQATDYCGAKDTCYFYVIVYDQPPVLTCPRDSSVRAGDEFVSSDFSVIDPEGDRTTVTFLDITPGATNTPIIVSSHVEWVTTYSEMGLYTIRLDATDSCGVKDTCSFQVGVTPSDSIPFAPAVNYGTGDGPASVFCADLDGDGDLDLAVANSYSTNVSILKNNGDGTFQPKVDYDVGSWPYSVFCADLDGDGDLDLAVANFWSNNISILKNNGDGTFESAVNYGGVSGPWCVFCADLDGDGDLDLAVANFNTYDISILKNNGDGTFRSAVNYGAGEAPSFVFCADLDGDGDLDLAVANQGSNNVSILKNNGDGTFQSAINYGAGDYPWSVSCAGLDGDNDLDIVVTNRNNISIIKNNGDGTFQSAVNYGAGVNPSSVFCTDLDGDGDMDLAVANCGSDNVSILKNNGDGTFQSAVNYVVGDCPRSVFCADLDGEGDFDLAAANCLSNNVSILKNLTQVPANQPPWAFSLISPSDQDTIFGSTIFSWQTPYDPNFGDQLRYELYISTSPGFEPGNTTVDSNLCVSKRTKAIEPGSYYWKVKARDNWGAVTWSTQTRSFESLYLTDTLYIIAFSPVDLIVTDPVGDSIGLAFNTILGATYDTTQDLDTNGDLDDIVTIPNRLVGDYLILIVAEPGGGGGTYSMGIRIDGSNIIVGGTHQPCPPVGEPDTFIYHAPLYLSGDATGDWNVDISDVVYLLNYLFVHGPAPDPFGAGDATCDGVVDASDIVYLLNYLFVKGPPPPSC